MWRYAAGKYDFPLLGDYPIIAGIRLLFLCRKKKYRKEVRVETENFVIVFVTTFYFTYICTIHYEKSSNYEKSPLGHDGLPPGTLCL